MTYNVKVTAGVGTDVAADVVTDATLGTVKVQYTKLMDGTLGGTSKQAVSSAGAAKVEGAGTAGTAAGGVLTVQGSASGTAVPITASVTGSGTATGAIRVELPTNGTGVIATVGAVTAITNALPAGTNAIGKLAVNTGVTIGAVEIAAAQTLATVTTVGAVTAITNALPAGTNAIGKLAANDGVDVGDVTVNNASGASAVNIQDGGNSITVDNGGTFAVQAASTHASGSIASGAFASGSIASGAIASGAVASGAIATGAFASGAVGSGAVASGAFASGALASGSIASGAMVDLVAEQTPITPASATATKGLLVGGQYNSTQATFTNGQQGSLQVSSRGEIKSNIMDAAGNARGANVTAANEVLVAGSGTAGTASASVVTVQGIASMTKLLVTPDANSAVNLAQVGGTNTVNGGVAGSQSVGGTVATNVAITANPLNLGAQAVSSENAAVTTARQVQLVADLVGKLIVLPYANPENFVSFAMTSAMTGTTSTITLAAPASGLRNYITQITVSNSHASVGTDVIIQDGNGGTTFYVIPAAAVYGGATLSFPTPLRQPTTATAVYVANVTTGSNTKVSLSGYKGA